MKTIFKIIAVFIVAILIISSAYVAINLGDTEEDDTTPPTIDEITGDTVGIVGKITTIYVTFSDNKNVTLATIYYKSSDSELWEAESILSGSFDITIPSDSDNDWYYFVTVDDAAGNGPVGDPSNDGSIYYTISVSENIEELTHTVFIEEATGETCKYCPGVSELIHELYNSGDYNFEYVSLVVQHEPAYKRLKDDYNNLAQPTVYIDGGYKVVPGGGEEKSDVDASKFIEAIRAAELRNVPKIKVNVTASYETNSSSFTTNVIVKNLEDDTYNGTLKVYLAEIVSRWDYQTGGTINHGFIDYIINEKFSVDSGEEYSPASKDWDLTDLNPENLMVVAVVFNPEAKKGYSMPEGDTEEDKYPFDAYYADAADSAKVVPGGNLPPKVSIANPVQGYLHIFGKPILKSILGITRLLGATTIEINASDEDGSIEKVEIYVDGKLAVTDEEAPYQYTLKRIGLLKSLFFRKHTIKVIAFDDKGKTSEDEIEIRARL